MASMSLTITGRVRGTVRLKESDGASARVVATSWASDRAFPRTSGAAVAFELEAGDGAVYRVDPFEALVALPVRETAVREGVRHEAAWIAVADEITVEGELDRTGRGRGPAARPAHRPGGRDGERSGPAPRAAARAPARRERAHRGRGRAGRDHRRERDRRRVARGAGVRGSAQTEEEAERSVGHADAGLLSGTPTPVSRDRSVPGPQSGLPSLPRDQLLPNQVAIGIRSSKIAESRQRIPRRVRT
jgi:hypothetical protein